VIAVPRAAAAPADAPSGVPVFSPHRLVPELVTTIPDPDEPATEGLRRAAGEEVGRLYDQLYEELRSGDKGPRHRMFGWPDLVQNPIRPARTRPPPRRPRRGPRHTTTRWPPGSAGGYLVSAGVLVLPDIIALFVMRVRRPGPGRRAPGAGR
jgi:hypothetical protein